MPSSGMLRRVAPVRTDISEELSASFIRVTRIGELGTTLAVTSNRRTLRTNTKHQVPPKRWFLQEQHGVTTRKTPFFIVTAVKTSNVDSYLFSFPTVQGPFNPCMCLNKLSKPGRSLFRSERVTSLVDNLCLGAVGTVNSRAALSTSSPSFIFHSR
jgi:hypothetical protein